ncbi:MAG TPA: formylglycine-generating enzyme family protein [Fimbriiglobus sp.]
MPAPSRCHVYKTVFTRQPFRVSDLAEAVYLRQETKRPTRRWGRKVEPVPPTSEPAPFTQLSGVWSRAAGNVGLFEPFDVVESIPYFRRRSDGMRCALLPKATVQIGCDDFVNASDESPAHTVELDAILIDAEPVSTTAYCRFLNSLSPLPPHVLTEWFVLDAADDRNEQAVIVPDGKFWKPSPGTEKSPVVLVSWFGANAYSLWANGQDWHRYKVTGEREAGSFLPSEAQWEYAARGPIARPFPWGSDDPTRQLMRFGMHEIGNTYEADTMPMAAVNEPLGVSPFGLYHMAGNVWQWCRDWYDDRFYRDPQATEPNPVNRTATGVRSERGGSWVGPAELCRSSYRRGRNPLARGRCLGFRCVSPPQEVN